MIINIILFAVIIFLIALAITALVHIFFLVPYVPSKNRVVKKMVSLAKLQPKETVYDLGCGDARLLIEASKKTKITPVGFEIAPLVYVLAKLRAFLSPKKIQVKFQNFFSANLHKANVIFCYLIPNVMPRLASKIKRECRRGTRIISNTFSIPGLKIDKISPKNAAKGMPTIYVYKI